MSFLRIGLAALQMAMPECRSQIDDLAADRDSGARALRTQA
jgi:hypothetical protein